MKVRRRGEVAGVKPSNQSGSQRVIEHGGQEAALDDPGGIHEGIRGSESNLDRSFSGLTVRSSQPSVAAAGGSGALPSTASQKGPSRGTSGSLTHEVVIRRTIVVGATSLGHDLIT